MAGHQQRALARHVAQPVHAGGGLFRQARHRPAARGTCRAPCCVRSPPSSRIMLGGWPSGTSNGLLDAPVELLLGHALPGEHRACRPWRSRRRRGPAWRRCCRTTSAPRRRARGASRSAPRSGWSCAGSRRCARPSAAWLSRISARRAIRPGISLSAMVISLRPQSARLDVLDLVVLRRHVGSLLPGSAALYKDICIFGNLRRDCWDG